MVKQSSKPVNPIKSEFCTKIGQLCLRFSEEKYPRFSSSKWFPPLIRRGESWFFDVRLISDHVGYSKNLKVISFNFPQKDRIYGIGDASIWTIYSVHVYQYNCVFHLKAFFSCRACLPVFLNGSISVEYTRTLALFFLLKRALEKVRSKLFSYSFFLNSFSIFYMENLCMEKGKERERHNIPYVPQMLLLSNSGQLLLPAIHIMELVTSLARTTESKK